MPNEKAPYFGSSGSSGSASTSDITKDNTNINTNYLKFTVRETTVEINNAYELTGELKRISEETGSYVKILKEYSLCPVLIGNDNNPVFLYRIIELIDEIIDYDKLKEEFTNLSYAHFNGAISFLKKLSQLNNKFIDIDELEDIALISNENFVNELRTAFLNEEGARVLNFGEFYSRATT